MKMLETMRRPSVIMVTALAAAEPPENGGMNKH
jgi:hypothetical protein